MTQEISIQQLVQLSPEELASDEIKELAEQVRAQNMTQTIKIKADDALSKKQEADLLMLNIDTTQFYPADMANPTILDSRHSNSSNMDEMISTSSLFQADSGISSKVENLYKALSYPLPAPKRDRNFSSNIENSKRIKSESLSDESTIITPITTNHIFSATSDIPQYDFTAYTAEPADTLYVPSPHTPEPIEVPEPVVQPKLNYKYSNEQVWHGDLILPTVGKFTGSFTQIGGQPIQKSILKALIHSELSIDGRIPTRDVLTYITQLIAATKISNKQITIMKFDPKLSSDPGYKSIFAHFDSKGRYGAIKSFPGVKDMYIVTIKKGFKVPEVFTNLGCTLEKSTGDCLYAVIVLLVDKMQEVIANAGINKVNDSYGRVQGNANPVLEALLAQVSAHSNEGNYELFKKMNELMNQKL